MYLRLFADSSGQVRLVARDEPTRTHLSAVHNAVTEAGFYRIEVQELARKGDRVSFDPESVEEGLSSLEGAAKPAIMKLISSGLTQFDDADWYRLYQFVALQTVRGNRWRAQLSTAITRSVRNAYVKDGVVPRDAVFPRIIPPKALVVQESLKMGLGTGENGDIGLSRYLIGKGVRLFRPSTTSVLTSDEPVCWWTPNTGASGYAQTPIVWLPLTPRLIVQFRDPEFDEIQHGVPADDDERAEFINGLVASQAERWIIHHPADTPSLGDRLPPRVSSSTSNPAQ